MCPWELTLALSSRHSSWHEMSGTSILGGVPAGVRISTAEGDGWTDHRNGVVTDAWNRKGSLNLSWLSAEVTQGNRKSKVKSEGSIWRPG